MFCSPHQKIIFSLAALLIAGSASAQSLQKRDPDKDSLSRYIQRQYGLDQELYNGFQNYNRYALYKGNPYFPEDHYYKGSVSIRGIQYEGVALKYDSYSQFLILEYEDLRMSLHQLIIGKVHADSFRLGNHSFQKLSLTGEEPLFYQELNSGPLTCYIHWKKELVSVIHDIQFSHEFTEPKRKYYVSYRGQIHPFTNRKSFISIFQDSLKPGLKKYFRQQQFSFRKADPEALQSMLDFVATYSEPVLR